MQDSRNLRKKLKDFKMTKKLFILMAVLASAMFVSCKKVETQGLVLDRTSAVLAVNTTLTLEAEIYPAHATNKEIIWTSDNPSVATVKDGVVSAIADGVAVITATTKDGNYKENCTILATSKTIYMAGKVDGKINGTAALWKNGVIQNLEEVDITKSSISYITSVFVSDNNDVYIAGEGRDETARFWKNGALQNLEDPIYGTAFSIFVSGNDVYVVGDGFTPGVSTVARLWKNGITQPLEKTNYYGCAYSVFVSQNDVYVVGRVDGKSRLWKNGIIQNWGNAGSAYYSSVFVSGNDVYVAGGVGSWSVRVATLWKNGVAQNLTDGNSFGHAYAVFVSGNDVYVVGGIDGVTTLWKNGIKQNLENADVCYTPSVFVSGNDVYVLGFRKLWVNGKVFNLDGEFRSIFVK